LGTHLESGELELSPRLADRAVVSRPDLVFRLARQQEIIVFVSSPLWLLVSSGGQALLDTPIYRPSDTWFGPPTKEGELCYASRTACNLRLPDCPVRSHRATTAVTVRNLADTELLIDQLKLPVHTLHLFEAADGRIWTQDALMERDSSNELAKVSGSTSPPEYALRPKPIAEPRQRAEPNAVVRAFSTLFSR